jgi:hypothetical protein
MGACGGHEASTKSTAGLDGQEKQPGHPFIPGAVDHMRQRTPTQLDRPQHAPRTFKNREDACF